MRKKKRLMYEALKTEHEKRANENLQTAHENFETIKLDKSENLEIVIASEKASLAVSNKRAYFSGNYIGSINEDKTEAVNLDMIKKVKLKTKLKKEFVSTHKYLITLLVIALASAISIIAYSTAMKQVSSQRERLNNVTASSSDVIRDYYYSYGMDSNFLAAVESASKEVEAKEKAIEKDLSDAYRIAYTYKNIMTTVLVISAFIIILDLINFKQEVKFAKYSLLDIKADKRKLGIEIRDSLDYDKICNILLVAKSNAGQPAIIVQTPVTTQEPKKQADKAERLIELSKLYEQNLITEEEFKELKTNVINS